MAEALMGKRVAFLVANEGVEQVELTEPLDAVRAAGAARDRTLTSWPRLQTDIRNAGGEWVDEEVHVDQGLVTSRKPDDLPPFCAKVVEELAEGVHEGQQPAEAASRD